MRRDYIIIPILLPAMLLLLLAISSCKRDHLYYEGLHTATVIVNPDWTKSHLHPNGVTVYAYNSSDGSLYKRFPPVSAQERCYIQLPKGNYTLIVMNDTPEEFADRIDFIGEENLKTLQAKGVQDLKRSKIENASGSLYCIVEPDTLAVALYSNLNITQQQIDYFWDKPENTVSPENAIKINVEPQRVVTMINIKAHVKGLKYARGTTISYFRGLAEGHMLGQGQNSMESVAQSFILNQRVFDPGSDSDGTIKASFLSFGMLGDGNTSSRYYLDINFVLINGEPYPLTFDVTDLITVDISLNLQLSLNINLEIELPEVIGDEGGGFNPDVGEWEDEIVDIPI